MTTKNEAVLRRAVLYPYLYVRSNITLAELNEKIEIDTLCCAVLMTEMEVRAQYLLDLRQGLK